MLTLTQVQIKEIADQLDCGFICYLNMKNGEILFLPDLLKHPDIEMEAWSEAQGKIDRNFHDYKVIEPLESYDSFKIMAEFAETLLDSNPLKNKLIYALNRKKPFREFKFAIDNSGKYRQIWFGFKNLKLQEWVKERIQEINEIEE